jgi:hypothetical protein
MLPGLPGRAILGFVREFVYATIVAVICAAVKIAGRNY